MTETTIRREALTLEIARMIGAPRAVVWRCWTEPALFQQWFCPAPWSVPEADFDLRPGGRMNTVMAGPNGERVENVGCYLEVLPQERLVFTDAFAEGFAPRPNPFMTGYVTLADAGDATRMVWGARHATEADRDRHLEMGFETGWPIVAGQLDARARSLA